MPLRQALNLMMSKCTPAVARALLISGGVRLSELLLSSQQDPNTPPPWSAMLSM